MRARWPRITAFFAATLLCTNGVSLLVAAARGPAKGNMLEGALRANIAMLVPGAMALVFARFVLRAPVRAVLGLHWRPNRWWLVAWLLPAATSLAVIGLELLAPGASLSPPKSGPWAILPL